LAGSNPKFKHGAAMDVERGRREAEESHSMVPIIFPGDKLHYRNENILFDGVSPHQIPSHRHKLFLFHVSEVTQDIHFSSH
jgi:hypothetical protein